MENTFALEESIMSCWNIIDELDLLTEYVCETENLDPDILANVLVGLKTLYEMKFEKCFSQFEKVISDDHEEKKKYHTAMDHDTAIRILKAAELLDQNGDLAPDYQ